MTGFDTIFTMQQRHFEFLAKLISTLDKPLRFTVAVHFANGLAAANPKFNRQRFIDAAKGEPK